MKPSAAPRAYRALSSFVLLATLPCCTSAGPEAAEVQHVRPAGFRPAPRYRPGASLESSRLCECWACDPSACCAGHDDEQRECSIDDIAEGSDVVDFGSAPGCGMNVGTCRASCARRAWRVPRGQSCSTRRPGQCCD